MPGDPAVVPGAPDRRPGPGGGRRGGRVRAEGCGRAGRCSSRRRSTRSGRTRVQINRQPLRRARDLLGAVRVTVFSPDDLALVKGGPAERRRLPRRPAGGAAIPAWTRSAPRWSGSCASERTLLKQAGRPADARGGAHPRRVGRQAGRGRRGAGRRPGGADRRAGAARSPRPTPSWPGRPLRPSASPTTLPGGRAGRATWPAALAAARRRPPPGRDDGRTPPRRPGRHPRAVCPSRTHASQGEQRSLALALRLAGHGVVDRARPASTPVLLLDDVFSRARPRPGRRPARRLPSGQALVTTAGPLPTGVSPAAGVRGPGGHGKAAGVTHLAIGEAVPWTACPTPTACRRAGSATTSTPSSGGPACTGGAGGGGRVRPLGGGWSGRRSPPTPSRVSLRGRTSWSASTSRPGPPSCAPDRPAPRPSGRRPASGSSTASMSAFEPESGPQAVLVTDERRDPAASSGILARLRFRRHSPLAGNSQYRGWSGPRAKAIGRSFDGLTGPEVPSCRMEVAPMAMRARLRTGDSARRRYGAATSRSWRGWNRSASARACTSDRPGRAACTTSSGRSSTTRSTRPWPATAPDRRHPAGRRRVPGGRRRPGHPDRPQPPVQA